jgi:hypothetical protein
MKMNKSERSIMNNSYDNNNCKIQMSNIFRSYEYINFPHSLKISELLIVRNV